MTTMTVQDALQHIAKHKFTGNCYMENSSRAQRVIVCEPGSGQDKECYERSRSSSKWTALGKFSNGKNLATIMHERVREEFFNILNGVYDLRVLIDTFNTYPRSLRWELYEALRCFETYCEHDIEVE